MFTERYGNAFDSNQKWNEIAVDSEMLLWNDASTYIQEPPFMVDLPVDAVQPLTGAKALAMLGDGTTTDRISCRAFKDGLQDCSCRTKVSSRLTLIAMVHDVVMTELCCVVRLLIFESAISTRN